MVSTKHIVAIEKETRSCCNKWDQRAMWLQRTWLILPDRAGKVSPGEVVSNLSFKGWIHISQMTKSTKAVLGRGKITSKGKKTPQKMCWIITHALSQIFFVWNSTSDGFTLCTVCSGTFGYCTHEFKVLPTVDN